MGELVLAAKTTHVPSIWMSEHSEKHKGVRDFAIRGLGEVGRRARERGAECFIIFDTHWIVNQGFHMNARESISGTFTSHELPHFLSGLEFSYTGDPDLADAIAGQATDRGLKALAHRVNGLGLEYGTLIPMRHMNPESDIRVLSIACNQYADVYENRLFGEAVRAAIEASGQRVALLASGSLSHEFWPNRLSAEGLNSVNKEFNRQMDLRVLDLWQAGRFGEFTAMLPEYITRCHGEAAMADTAMFLGALGWDSYDGKVEIITDYFGSSGTGQCIADFPVG